MVPHFIVSPVERLGKGWKNVALRVSAGADLIISEGMSIRRIEFESWRDFLRRDILERFADRLLEGVRIVVGISSPDHVAELTGILQESGGLNVWVRPLAEHYAVARAAGSAGVPVLFPDGDAGILGDTLGLDLLDYYLFDPGLAVPLEPFHSLLRAELGENRSLWNIWFGRAEEHFFVAADGQVSLCAAWLGLEGRSYGQSSAGRENWVASEGHRFLRLVLSGEHLPERCQVCPVVRRCQGAVWALTAGSDCEQWREILTRVHLAARAMASRQGNGGRPAASR